jgi:hypothetical protein
MDNYRDRVHASLFTNHLGQLFMSKMKMTLLCVDIAGQWRAEFEKIREAIRAAPESVSIRAVIIQGLERAAQPFSARFGSSHWSS